jgi:hypothetical protein
VGERRPKSNNDWLVNRLIKYNLLHVMNAESILQASRNSITQKIIDDPFLADEKKALYLNYFLSTDYSVKKSEELDDEEFVRLQLHEGYLRDCHLNGEFNLVDFVYELKRKFRIKSEDKYLGLYNLGSVAIGNFKIHIEDLEEFIHEYRDFRTMAQYTIPKIAMSRNIDWNNDFILRYADLLSFHHLHRNPKVIWNFELIEKLKDRLNWSYISSYEYLQWTPEKLYRYRDYLVFSVEKNDWQKCGKNKIGSTYSILHVSEYPPNPYSYLKGSISSSESIVWSEEIIDIVIDYWDWEELCANRSIYWSERLIDKYASHIDFISLSTNSNVQWGIDLMYKYQSRFDWRLLSVNSGLPWSINFIEEFSGRWTWKLEYNYYWNEGWKGYPCLSSNEGIYWSALMVEKWKEQLDFWLIARNGKIAPEVLYDFKDEFRRNENIRSVFHRDSDWRATEEIFETGWQCLVRNKNFKITKDILPLLQNEEIELRLPVFYNFARTKEYEHEWVSLLEICKDCPLDGISLSDVVSNYNNWGKTFVNNDFVNSSFYQQEIIPFIANRVQPSEI